MPSCFEKDDYDRSLKRAGNQVSNLEYQGEKLKPILCATPPLLSASLFYNIIPLEELSSDFLPHSCTFTQSIQLQRVPFF